MPWWAKASMFSVLMEFIVERERPRLIIEVHKWWWNSDKCHRGEARAITCVYTDLFRGIQEPRAMCINSERDPDFLGPIVIHADPVVAMDFPVTPFCISCWAPMKLTQSVRITNARGGQEGPWTLWKEEFLLLSIEEFFPKKNSSSMAGGSR